MSIEENVQIVKDFFAALGRRDKQGLLALSAENIEWIVPGEGWPLAGTHRGHAGVENVLQKANETVETAFPEPPEFVAQGGPGSGHRLRHGKNQSHEQDIRGLLGLRRDRSKWQIDEHSGVYRHASTGVGFRDGRESHALTHRLIPIPGLAAKVRILRFRNLPPFRHDRGLQIHL